MGVIAELKGAWRVYRERRRELADEAAQPVELVYTDKLGNNWYAFKDPMRMPGDRALAALVASRRSDLNYTVEDEREWLKAVRTAANLGEFMDVGYYLRVKEDRATWACEEATLLDVAKSYFLVNDEPQGQFREAWQRKKAEAWAADEDCRAFFLREAYWLTRGFSELSLADIPAYLEERKKRIRTASNERQSARPGARRTASSSPE